MTTKSDIIQNLKKFMEENGYTQEQMAGKLEISRQYLNLILNGNKPITSTIAIKLEPLTSRSLHYWLGKKQDTVYQESVEKLIDRWIPYGCRLLVDHEIKTAVDSKYIKIKPFKEEHLDPTSYCLSIGKKILLSHEKESIHLEEGDSIEIQPGQEAAFLTEETIAIPQNISAKVCPTTKVIDSVINLNKGSIVHPGYEGIIYFTLNNYSKRAIKIVRGAKIIRIQFTFLPVAPEQTYKGAKQGLDDFPEELVKSFYTDDTKNASSKTENLESKIDQLLKKLN